MTGWARAGDFASGCLLCAPMAGCWSKIWYKKTRIGPGGLGGFTSVAVERQRRQRVERAGDIEQLGVGVTHGGLRDAQRHAALAQVRTKGVAHVAACNASG